MATIEEFVDHIWVEARKALQTLDSEFVEQLDNLYERQQAGAAESLSADERPKPTHRLSHEWHLLLEACFELTRQLHLFRFAAKCLSETSLESSSAKETGLRIDYDLRAWFTHAETLAERANLVVKRTITVFSEGSRNNPNLTKSFRVLVDKAITDQVKDIRNKYMHATRGDAQAITEAGLWEGPVVLGLTPQRYLDDLRSYEIKTLKELGTIERIVSATETMLEELGAVFVSLRTQITSQPDSDHIAK